MDVNEWEEWRKLEAYNIIEEIEYELHVEIIREIVDKHWKRPKKEITVFQLIIFCITVVFFLVFYIIAVLIDEMLVYVILEIPIMKPLIIVLPPALYRLYQHNKNKPFLRKNKLIIIALLFFVISVTIVILFPSPNLLKI